jgi:hypothetical protein
VNRLALLGVLLWTGCSHRGDWKEDEGARIDEGIRCEPYHPHLPAARGIAVVDAPAMAPPWAKGESYDFDTFRGRKARLGKVSRRPPRAASTETRADAQP